MGRVKPKRAIEYLQNAHLDNTAHAQIIIRAFTIYILSVGSEGSDQTA